MYYSTCNVRCENVALQMYTCKTLLRKFNDIVFYFLSYWHIQPNISTPITDTLNFSLRRHRNICTVKFPCTASRKAWWCKTWLLPALKSVSMLRTDSGWDKYYVWVTPFSYIKKTQFGCIEFYTILKTSMRSKFPRLIKRHSGVDFPGNS